MSEGALKLGLRLAAELEKRGIPYALGGALSYGANGLPRTTLDVDVNVFLEPEQLDPTFEALRALGAAVDSERARQEAIEQGMFVTRADGLRIDVFTPSIPFSWEAQKTRKRFSFGGGDAWYLSAEALSVFKLLFFRGKDIVDLERLVATQGPKLDHAYVRKHIVEMMGEDDERTKTWDRMVREFGQTGE